MPDSPIRLIPIASSSQANCTAIVAGGMVVIIDAGISRKQLIGTLSEMGVLTKERPSPALLLLSHEHSDHSKYFPIWLDHPQPIFATAGTAGMLGIERIHTHFRIARPFEPIQFNGLTMTPIMVPHDAAEPVAWRVAFNGAAAIVATDLGSFPPGWDLFCKGATDLLIEANYHPKLLELCDYLPSLKARIAAHDGHMNLFTVAEWLRDKAPATLKRLFLGHLSKKCCHPKIVRHTIAQALANRPDINVTVLEN